VYTREKSIYITNPQLLLGRVQITRLTTFWFQVEVYRERERGHLDFEVALLVGFPEGGEGFLAAEDVLEQVLAAQVSVYDGVGEELGDVALGVAVRPCAREADIQLNFPPELGRRCNGESKQDNTYRRCRWASS
jgi:hypothetical protein